MVEELLIRKIYKTEWEEAMRIAWDTFILFEAPEYSKEGIKNFKNFVNDPILKQMFIEGKYLTLAAFHNGLMVGVIGVRNENHISLLFVDSEFHHRGIATKLVEKAKEYVKNEYHRDFMTVNSSPYAVGFYHKFGFYDTDNELTTDGIRYTPMLINFQ